MDFTELRHLAEQIETECGKAIIGKGEQIRLVLTSLFAGGHVLIDDIPGVGKTTLVKALSAVLGCGMVRVQFTPDLLPSDIVGMNIYSQKTGEMVFTPGPIMTNILLADEINRAIPRTQSALLEAMEERQVSVDGVTYPLAPPFMVLATQNPRGDGDHLRPARCPAGPLPLQALHGLPHPQGGGRHAPNRGRWSRLCGPPPPALPRGNQSVHPGDPAGPPVRSGGGVHRGAGPGHPGAAGAGLRRQPPGCPGTCSGPPKPMPPSPAGTMSPRTM